VRPRPPRPCRAARAAELSQRPGSEYTAVRFTEHLALEGIAPSIGTVGDASNNGLMDSIIGLFKTECIRTTIFHSRPYKTSPTSYTPPRLGRHSIDATVQFAIGVCSWQPFLRTSADLNYA
jgi:transposase InsO family protein